MKRMPSISHLAGGNLVLSFVVVLAGALLFMTRPGSATAHVVSARLVVERAFIMGAVVLTAIGFLLLNEHLSTTSGRGWMLIGAYLYLIGSVVIIVAELLGLSGGGSTYPLIVAYVLLALVAQAAIGVAIILSGAMPAAVGWIVIGWNLAWLVILPVTTPSDVYYPLLHHLMPLLLGIVLLRGS